jgi:hypothetical protein
MVDTPWSERGYRRPQVVLVVRAVVAEPVGAVVAGDKLPGVVVVVEPPPLLLLHALLTRAIPASTATAVTRRMWGIAIPSSVSDPTLVGYPPVGLWWA